MPQSKLDGKKLDSYKKLLMKLKGDLVHDINSMSQSQGTGGEDSRDVSGHVLHMADVATDMYDREFNLGLASNEREVLQKIEVALKKINEQNYGCCVKCDKSIPMARLKAIPYVETCLKCQEKLENEG